MPDRLPLFPLGLVLLPGAVLPLHVFEDRYRVLVGELLERPEPERVFGVVAIRQGREVGEDGVAALHEVGCVARVRRVTPYPDGRYDLVATGAGRFRVDGVERGRPYAVGQVTWLPEPLGDGVQVADAAVRKAYGTYVAVLADVSGGEPDLDDLPAEPGPLSYAVAAAALLDLDERQALLAEPTTASRLRATCALLRRETGLLKALGSAPAPELTRGPVNPN